MSPTISAPGTWPDSGHWCRERRSPARGGQPAPSSRDLPVAEPEDAILCRACRARVTSRQQAVAVNGTHIHTFFNPAGIVYEICCFRKAEGCAVYGDATAEFAWFAGSHWQYASCAACQEHLGWFFTTPVEFFFGLIRNRLFFPPA